MRALVLAVLVLAAPSATASLGTVDPAPTTLYFHVIDVQDIPINTQEPDSAWTDDGLFGPVATLTCLHPTTGDIAGTGMGTGGVTAQDFATRWAYGTPGLVEYLEQEPKTHSTRTLSFSPQILASPDPVLTWYLATGIRHDALAMASGPTTLANVQLRATMQASDLSPGPPNPNAPILMQGSSPIVTLFADQVVAGPSGSAGVRAVGERDGLWVYEFQVPLSVSDSLIPRTGFNMRIELFVVNEACDPDEGVLMPNPIGPYTTEGLRPRLDLVVAEPLRAEYLHPQWVGPDLVVHTSINSPWGNYDIDQDSLQITVTGPAPSGFRLVPLMPRFHEHGRNELTDALDLAWVWEDAPKELENGPYEIGFSVSNRQGTATLQASTSFDGTPAQESPVVGPLVWVAALAGLAAVWRRR